VKNKGVLLFLDDEGSHVVGCIEDEQTKEAPQEK
jgi:hypothetical protein